jgi:hypothetical protein
MRALVRLALLVALVAGCGGGGSGDGGGAATGANLDGFAVARITVADVGFEAWLADSDAERRQGFMRATEEQLAPLPDGTPRGMLFTYASDQRLSFFMRDTQVPLDLAYATSEGRIVEVHRLEPFDETSVVAAQPVRFAFEARQGTFARHGIGVGDRIELPAR